MTTKWKLFAVYFDWQAWRFGLSHHDNVGVIDGKERCLRIGPLVLEWRDAEQMMPDHDMR
jgi:hypothetical protein